MENELGSQSEAPEPRSGGTPAPPPPRPRWIAWVAGVAVIAVALAGFLLARGISGSGSNPSAAPPANSAPAGLGSGARAPGTSGTITSISGSMLTVQTNANGSVPVKTTSSTRITAAKPAGVSAIAKGDRIAVTGSTSGSTIAATRITDSGTANNAPSRGNGGGFAAGGGARPGTANGQPAGGGFTLGTVTSLDGGTIVISDANGSTTTVTTSPSTAVTKTQSITLNDLAPGQTVRVNGTAAADGTIAAVSINEGSGQFQRPGA